MVGVVGGGLSTAVSRRSVPLFRMERAVPITGQSPRALLHWTEGTRHEAGRSESVLLGTRPREKREAEREERRSPSPLLSSPLLRSPPALCPSAQAAEEPSRPSCAGIRMFSGGQTDFGPGACTEEDGTGHTAARRCQGPKIIHKEARRACCFRVPIVLFPGIRCNKSCLFYDECLLYSPGLFLCVFSINRFLL